MSAPIQLPRAGTGILLRDLTEAVYLSRIESWTENRITVVKPMRVPAAFPYPTGTPFDLLWTSPIGQHVLPCELADVRAENKVRLWDLTPVAEPWVEQRREFVRVPVFGRIALTGGNPAQPVALSGYLVDVSEVAVQCAIWANADEPTLFPGSEVTAEFTAHGTVFTRRARVYGSRPGPEDSEMTVVLRFDQSPGEATDLRKAVFAAQVDLRQLYRRRREFD